MQAVWEVGYLQEQWCERNAFFLIYFYFIVIDDGKQVLMQLSVHRSK